MGGTQIPKIDLAVGARNWGQQIMCLRDCPDRPVGVDAGLGKGRNGSGVHLPPSEGVTLGYGLAFSVPWSPCLDHDGMELFSGISLG